MNDLFASPEFPRSSHYNPEWIQASVSGGANPLWLTEWLARALDLRPRMRGLDLGCGRAMSSIFLHREFGVQVWAIDLMCSVSENLQRIRDAGVEELRDEPCADLELLPASKQAICTSRNFGRPVTELSELLEATTTYAGNCAKN